jgi:hypothetical protein
MPVTPYHLLTGGSTDNVYTFTTESITPTAGRLICVGVLNSANASPAQTVSVTGCGLTWDPIVQTSTAARQLSSFRARGTPTAGPLTITLTGGTTTPNGCAWTVIEYDGADTSGTNGSGAILQTVNSRPGSATSISALFTGVPAPGNGGFGLVAMSAAETITPGSGWTAQQIALTAPPQSLAGLYAASCPAAVAGSWSSSATNFAIGVEIKALGAGGSLNRVKLGTTTAKLYLGTTAIPKAYLGTTQIYP